MLLVLLLVLGLLSILYVCLVFTNDRRFNAILHFTPQLVSSFYRRSNMNLICAIIVSLYVDIRRINFYFYWLNKLGRKPLLNGGGTLMFLDTN